jgi:hypothetical protein
MKLFKWLVYSLVVILLTSCGSSESNKTYSHKEQGNSALSAKDNGGKARSTATKKPKSTATPTKKPNPTATATARPVSISIHDETAPFGILEQISWGGQGGPGDEPDPKKNCGNCEAHIKGDLMTFTDFEPLQKLKVLLYKKGEKDACNLNTLEYVTKLYIQMDENGNFSSDLTGSTDDLLIEQVTDTSTSEELWLSAYVAYGRMSCSTEAQSCPGAPKQRLKVNETAYVCTRKDSVKLREGPGKNYSAIKSLSPGAEVTITGGPKCADNWSWWQVQTKSGYTGWMTEGGDSIDPYFLCPNP